ncbi:hypothetical protein NEOKW01_0958 [Nematocida sp. AWRm80]|nr:hypothetical protein NEOKW01_0958 [Nematocida sp. AWRm80]
MSAVKFTTTGISVAEKNLIRRMFQGTEYILEENMSSECDYVLTYRCMFTEKKIIAEKWSIPIISVSWVYRSLCMKNILSYRLRKYEGAIFSTSSITDTLYINYYLLHGAHYQSDLNRSCDFLVVRNESVQGSKLQHALECNIPVVLSKDVFYDRLEVFQKEINYNSFSLDVPREDMFNGLVFYFEGTTQIHHLIRQAIVQHGGNRVDRPGEDVTYTVYFGDKTKGKNLVWYQWILDSIELGHLLAPDAYFFYPKDLNTLPLKGLAIYLGMVKEDQIPIRNMIASLGGIVHPQINSQVTCCIVGSKSKTNTISIKNALEKYRISVYTQEWIHQCIYHMRRVKEDRYQVYSTHKPISEMQSQGTEERPSKRKAILSCIPICQSEWNFQFSGLSESLKKETKDILDTHQIEYTDTSRYSKRCTHLVVGVVGVTVKLLSAIACGAILVDYKIIDDLKENIFKDVSKYTLETRSLAMDVGKNATVVKTLIRHASYWRKRKERTGLMAFSEWKLAILKSTKEDLIREVVENGGGQIVPLTDASIFFTDSISDLPPGIPSTQCINMVYIINYLSRRIEHKIEATEEKENK